MYSLAIISLIIILTFIKLTYSKEVKTFLNQTENNYSNKMFIGMRQYLIYKYFISGCKKNL